MKMAVELQKLSIAVDLIVTLNSVSSIDLPSMSPLIWYTGGDLIYYNPFIANEHSEKLHYEIFRVLTRN